MASPPPQHCLRQVALVQVTAGPHTEVAPGGHAGQGMERTTAGGQVMAALAGQPRHDGQHHR